MARWGSRRLRATAVVAALTLAVTGLAGLPAAAGTLDAPTEPLITASYNGVEILDCGTQTTCPKIAVTGEAVTFTITATSPDVVRHRYRFNSTTAEVAGANVTLPLTPSQGGWNTLNVQSINESGQFSEEASFLFNVGPRPGPVGSWGFDDGSGTTAADTAVPAHPLTLANGASLDGKGRIVGSLALDGTDDYAQATEPVVDTSKSFTIAAWARPTHPNRNGVVAAVTGTNSSAFGLYYDAAAKRWVFARTSADTKNPTLYRALSKEAPVDGAWAQLIGSYNAATGALQLLVNGRLQQTSSSPTTAAWHAAGPLTIGRGKYGSAFTGQFSGSLDQVAIWQRLLVDDEIQPLVEPRQLGRVAAGVAAYWPLDNAVKASATVWRTPELMRGADLTVSGFGATSNQSAAFVDDAERGRVLELTGRARESVTLSPSVVDGSGSFTVAAWVKLGDLDKPVVVARQGTAGKDSWRLEYKPLDVFSGQWIFARGDAGSAAETLAIATVDRDSLAGWHVLTGSYAGLADGPTGEPTSKLELTVDQTPFDGSRPAYSGTPLRTGTTVVGSGRTAGKDFSGRLDDLRLYAGVVSGSRLCEDYPDLDSCPR